MVFYKLIQLLIGREAGNSHKSKAWFGLFSTNTQPIHADTYGGSLACPQTPSIICQHHLWTWLTKLPCIRLFDSDWGLAQAQGNQSLGTSLCLVYHLSPGNQRSKALSLSPTQKLSTGHSISSCWSHMACQVIRVDNLKPITLHCDNQSALYIAKNHVFHERTKHINLDCHFTKEKVMEGLFQLSYLPPRNQLADFLTTILPSSQLKELLSKLGRNDPTSKFDRGCCIQL